MLYEVYITNIMIDQESNSPIIVLTTLEDKRSVPIWIGLLEATAIVSEIQNIKYERPMTHDLFKNFIVSQNAIISKVEIFDLRDNTYFSKIYFVSESKVYSMDARPSDAIAMALRFKAPIYIEDNIIEQSKIKETKYEAADKSSEGKKWADYLSKLPDENFGKCQ